MFKYFSVLLLHNKYLAKLVDMLGSLAKGEMQARTTYQRSAKGPITISDCPPDGKFVRIENTGRKVSAHSATESFIV